MSTAQDVLDAVMHGTSTDAEGSFLQQLLDELDDGVYFVDMLRTITFWSKGAERITGFPAEEVVGSSCSDNVLVHVDEVGTNLCENGCPLAASMLDGQRRVAHVFLRHKCGHRVPVTVRSSPILDRFGGVIGAVETFSGDGQSDERDERIRQLAKLAFVDALTGLANRRYLDNALATKISERSRSSLGFGVLLIDVDKFKNLNDTYGHDAGDSALCVIANTLMYNSPPGAITGRWGGEEFLIIVNEDRPAQIHRTGERLRTLVHASRILSGGATLHATISVGATAAQADDDLSGLVRRADEYLYESKRTGRNRVTSDA